MTEPSAVEVHDTIVRCKQELDALVDSEHVGRDTGRTLGHAVEHLETAEESLEAVVAGGDPR